MELHHLKQKKEETRLRMKRLYHKWKLLSNALCSVRGEYLELKEEFNRLDREIAEHYVQTIEGPGSESKSNKKVNGDSINLDNLTADQIAMLKARIEQEMEGE